MESIEQMLVAVPKIRLLGKKENIEQLLQKQKEKYITELEKMPTVTDLDKITLLKKQLVNMANMFESIECDNQSKIIVFDTETTGLDSEMDEVLQLSIIDGDGKVLLNEYVQPYIKAEWPKAQEINNISPEMVRDSYFPHELIPKVKGIFDSAEVIIGYNVKFDAKFIRNWGIDIQKDKLLDVMTLFADIYGEWNEKYQNFKWQKLQKCADYFGYEFCAHDSLGDAKATLYCLRKLEEMMDSGEYVKIAQENRKRVSASKDRLEKN